MKGNFAAIVLTLIGVVALAVNLDLFQLDIVALLRKWWPLALIAVGLALFLTPGDGGRKNSGS
jgi:LiaI-LiaF-like transmembrane region